MLPGPSRPSLRGFSISIFIGKIDHLNKYEYMNAKTNFHIET